MIIEDINYSVNSIFDTIFNVDNFVLAFKFTVLLLILSFVLRLVCSVIQDFYDLVVFDFFYNLSNRIRDKRKKKVSLDKSDSNK